MDIPEFLKVWGTLIIAVYGVVQVWLIALWKRKSAGKLRVFKTGLLEIGYSNFGPTLAANGTLRAVGKDVFVSDIALAVKRISDNSTHQLEWTAFRSAQLHLAATDPMTIELPSGFNVRVNQPHRYHIFFSDFRTRDEILPGLTSVRKEWQAYLISKRDEILTTSRSERIDAKLVVQHLYDNDFSRNSEAHHKTWEVLNRKMYWSADEYEMTMIVKTSLPDRQFTDVRRFAVTPADFEELQVNAAATLREICLQEVAYYFAYVDYE